MKLRPDADRIHQATEARRLRVGVLVDLPYNAQSGGHIRCWERLAHAALDLADLLDLTVHFASRTRETRPIGDNVRFMFEPPVFSTSRLTFLSHVPDHTDLAPWHSRLARALETYDVIHTTDAFFAYARTAMRVSRRHGIPVVNSVHTNTPEYSRLFAAQTIERLCGRNALSRLLIDGLGVPRLIEARMNRQLADHQRDCAAILVSRPDESRPATDRSGGPAVLLGRGLDHQIFTPARRDRVWAEEKFGIPSGRVLILFVGRLNRGKNVALLVNAMHKLVARGAPVHLLCAGEGDQREGIRAALGDHVSCPGYLDADTLARLYASADIFAFPSKIEECANVVLEALASGLPTLVARESGMARFIKDGETGFALSGDSPRAWVECIDRLARDTDRRAAMGLAARTYAERRIPSWTEILAGTLLPLWRRVAAEAEAA